MDEYLIETRYKDGTIEFTLVKGTIDDARQKSQQIRALNRLDVSDVRIVNEHQTA